MMSLRRLIPGLLLLAALQAFVYRAEVFSDGIAYLDLSDLYLDGAWLAAANALWSPLYPFLLAAARLVLGRGAGPEFAIAHLVNYVVFLSAGLAYAQFLREMFRDWRGRAELREAVRWIAWVLFGWAAVDLVRLSKVSPDMIVLATSLFANALLLRLRAERSGAVRLTWVLLGIVLAVGYYAKAAMALVGAACLATALLPAIQTRRKGRWAAAAVTFAVLCAPLAAALSYKLGRITFSEAGRLNYAWHVAGIPDAHFQGGNPVATGPRHPTRRIAIAPAMYEYRSPIAGTYPVWLEPAYWYEGVTARFSASRQLAALSRNAGRLVRDFFASRNALIVLPLLFTLAVLLRNANARLLRSALRGYAPVLLPAMLGLTLYLPVHVETRYVAPFVLTTLVCGLAAVCQSLPETGPEPAVLTPLRWLLALYLAAIGAALVAMAARDLYSRSTGGERSSVHWAVVGKLPSLGASAGDTVFFIGDAFNSSAWVRLARMRIVGETPATEVAGFWAAARSDSGQIWRAVRQTGARWAFSDTQPPQALLPEWRPVAGTGFYLRSLD